MLLIIFLITELKAVNLQGAKTKKMSDAKKISVGVISVIGLILGYRYLVTIPKLYIESIDGKNKTVTYKIGVVGKPQTISVKEILDKNNSRLGKKIRNGIVFFDYDSKSETMKFSTYNEDESIFVRYTMVYFNYLNEYCLWENSDNKHGEPTKCK